jgi:hypothetical protein
VVVLCQKYGYHIVEFVSIPAKIGGGAFGVTISRIYIISIVTLVFGFYPVNYNIIKRRSIENIITEHTYVKNILYIEIPILIFATFVKVATLISFFSIDNRALMLLIGGLIVNLGLSVTAGIIYMIIHAARKELKYYFAKACFEVISKEKDETRKANYLIMGIKFYDKYLRRTLNLQINDVKKIYSKILSDSDIDKNGIMQSISICFESDDKLKPLKFLSKISNIKEPEQFLIDESLGHKIKDMAVFFATIIPVAIAIIQLWLQK